MELAYFGFIGVMLDSFKVDGGLERCLAGFWVRIIAYYLGG